MKQTRLYDVHVEMGAKMTPFGGFNMPVWYSSLKDEHHAVRESAGVFDISHMGVLLLEGTDAEGALQNLVCNDVRKSKGGSVIYAMILKEDGCVLDDVMLGELAENKWVLVVNASNLGKILDWVTPKLNGDVKLTDMTATHGFLAVQGPTAVATLSELFDVDLLSKDRFALFETELDGVPVTIMRSGYTGEDGVEISASNEQIEGIWRKITSKIKPCGLAARDTLRLEAGLPLYGQELSETITPLMTRYGGWVLKFDTDFIGKEALLDKKDAPKEWTTVGLEMVDRVIPRHGYAIVEGGEVTSGTLSPSLDKPIAMAMVKAEYAKEGTELHVDIRGKHKAARVVKLPFYKK